MIKFRDYLAETLSTGAKNLLHRYNQLNDMNKEEQIKFCSDFVDEKEQKLKMHQNLIRKTYVTAKDKNTAEYVNQKNREKIIMDELKDWKNLLVHFNKG